MQAEPDSFVIGSGPFCAATADECPKALGYKASIEQNTNCWTGNKYRCTFDPELFKTTDLGKEAANAKLKSIKFEEFGNAPLCDAENDFVAAIYSKLPVAKTQTGLGGNACQKGEKVIAIEPFTEAQRDEVEKLKEKYYKEGVNRKNPYMALAGDMIKNLLGGNPLGVAQTAVSAYVKK